MGNEINGKTSEYALLLRKVSPETLPKFISQNMDDKFLTNFLNTMKEQFCSKDNFESGINYMTYFAKCERFEVNLMFMSDKVVLKQICSSFKRFVNESSNSKLLDMLFNLEAVYKCK